MMAVLGDAVVHWLAGEGGVDREGGEGGEGGDAISDHRTAATARHCRATINRVASEHSSNQHGHDERPTPTPTPTPTPITQCYW